MNNKTENNVQDVQKKKRNKVNHVWWLPLIALLIVSFLGIKHFTSKGPLITVQFSNAEGLEINKTKVKYKDVDIGTVEKIDLNTENQYVEVAIRMSKESEDFLRKNTKFWVVKPRISITQISGLGTLLSGNYISIDPDFNKENNYLYNFIGLEIPPITTNNKPGLSLTLLSSNATSLYPGTAVYYRGMQVGTVNRVYFSSDYSSVKADIFIDAPHDKLIKQTTNFWSASGVSVTTGASGIEVNMESVEALISGGIAFDTPVSLTQEKTVTNSTEFVLHKNKKEALEQNYGKKHYYITYFNSSVQGLAPGSPVMVQGINVGKVKDVKIIYDSVTEKMQIPVLFEVYENHLGLNQQVKETNDAVFDKLIRDGLHTKLETGNFLTGAKHISLTFLDDDTDTVELVNIDDSTGYPIIPSAPENLNAITSGVNDLVKKLNQIPLEDLSKHVDELIVTVNKTLTTDLKKTIDEANTLLSEGNTLSKTARKTLNQLNQSVKSLAKTTKNTLSGYSPDGPLYYNLNATLTELNDTLRSLKSVSDTIDRTPNALIFGEGKPNGKK